MTLQRSECDLANSSQNDSCLGHVIPREAFFYGDKLRALRHWLDKEGVGNYEILKYNGQKEKKKIEFFLMELGKTGLGEGRSGTY